MEQHPIPQQISSYQFRLIGDMTLKQFSQLAGGVVIAILIYSLPILSVIKWFLVIFFVFLGFALAFLPLEDRPLDKWITAFIRSIYSPTQYIWQKTKKIPDFLQEITTKSKKAAENIPQIETTRPNLEEYFETFSPRRPESKIEKEEQLALEKMNSLFQATKLPTDFIPETRQIEPEEQTMPQIKVRPHKLRIPPSEAVVLKIGIIPNPVRKPKKSSVSTITPTPKIRMPPFKRQSTKTAVEAVTSTDLPIPDTPRQPNVIVGMILDHNGKIVERAIAEIRDKDGIPVRALRSNRLGQFQIVNPLPDGAYEIEIEKEGFEFDIIKLNLTGEVVAPIEIRAK
ncbi:MAG TPA: PrgI family protein [Candidatus Bathyarchaeia archaeon]|nr:PrgI family protein [Candidatus Bathyarchaeia archaeon]